MEATVTRIDLLDALSAALTTVTKKGNNPALQCTRIATTDKAVEIDSASLDSWMNCRVEKVDVAAQGQCLLDGDKLFRWCRESSEETFHFGIDSLSGNFIIRSGENRFTLLTVPMADFPARYDPAQTKSAVIVGARLAEMIESVHPIATSAAASAQHRILFETMGDNRINVVATDGSSQLIVRSLGCKESVAGSFLITPDAAQNAAKVFNHEAEVTILNDNNRVTFTDGFTTYTVSQLEGNFPKYEDFMTKAEGARHSMKFDRNVLLSAVRQAAIFCLDPRDGTMPMKLSAMPKSLKIVGKAAQLQTPCELTGDGEASFTVNGQHLQRALDAAETDEIGMYHASPRKPILISAGPSFRFNLMPMVIPSLEKKQ